MGRRKGNGSERGRKEQKEGKKAEGGNISETLKAITHTLIQRSSHLLTGEKISTITSIPTVHVSQKVCY